MARSQRAELTEYLAVAHDLADLAGKAITPHFRRALRVDNKASGGNFDPVTAADRAAERIVSRTLKQRLPGHGIEGEEYGSRDGDGRWRWIVDPIDGTRAFILGLPIWGTLIGLNDDGVPVLGMMDQPYTRERFWATPGKARFRGPEGREKPIKVRSCARLADAMLTTTHPDMFAGAGDLDRFMAVKARARATRYGGDCYTYCLLAAGHIDLVIESGLKPVDIAPLIPIIEAAGGIVTAWDGGSPARGGRVIAAGDRRIHAEALKLLGA